MMIHDAISHRRPHTKGLILGSHPGVRYLSIQVHMLSWKASSELDLYQNRKLRTVKKLESSFINEGSFYLVH